VIATTAPDATAANALAAGAIVWRVMIRAARQRLCAQFRLAAPAIRRRMCVCIDADCDPGVDCIATIAHLAPRADARPVQAGYTMFAPAGTSGLAQSAWRFT